MSVLRRTSGSSPSGSQVLALALVACVAACTPPSTALVVRVDSNLAPRTQLTSFTMTVQREGAPAPFPVTDYSLLDARNAWPASLSVIPHDVTDRHALTVVVTGHAVGGTTITQRARVTLSYTHVSLLEIFLASECTDGSAAATCPAGQTCSRGGACVPIDRTLPDFTQDAANPTDAALVDITTDNAGSDVFDASVDVSLTPDATVDVPVTPDAIDVRPDCTPNCAGRMCGDDGCGHPCGSCPSFAPCSGAGRCACGTAMQTLCASSCTDLGTDALNCGSCGHVCPPGTGGTPMCAAGTCVLACAAGTANCDGNASNGCETALGTLSACGACFDACTSGLACNTTLDVTGRGQCCREIVGSPCPGSTPVCGPSEFGYCDSSAGNAGFCCGNLFTAH